MRRRLFAVLVVMLVLVAALPLSSSAAAPRSATFRITSTTYTDTSRLGNGTLCSEIQILPPVIQTTIAVSQQSNVIGNGSGTGTLTITPFGDFAIFNGGAEVNGLTLPINSVGVPITCLLPGYAVVAFSTFGTVELPSGEEIFAEFLITGTIQDGVHRNQGRVSLTVVITETSQSPL